MILRLLTVIVTLIAQSSATGDPTVVFVCEHGAAKSVIATAYFNKLAAERGLPFRATFRGRAPQDNLSVRAVEGLRADGVIVPAGRPTAIDESDIAHATHLRLAREGARLWKGCRLVGRAGRSRLRTDARRDRATRDGIVGRTPAIEPASDWSLR